MILINGHTHSSSYDTDAAAYFALVTGYSDPQKTLISNFFTSLKADSLWSKVTGGYILFAGTESDAKWNYKDLRDLDAAYRLVKTTVAGGGPTFSGNGVSFGQLGYLNTFYAASSLSQDNNHLALYSRTSGGIAGNDMGASDASFANATYISMRWSDDQDYTRNMASAGGRAYTSDTRFYINNRVLSTEYKIFADAGTVTTTTTSVASTTRTIWIGSYNAPTPNYGGRELSYASFGQGFNDTEAANYRTHVNTLLTGFGINV